MGKNFDLGSTQKEGLECRVGVVCGKERKKQTLSSFIIPVQSCFGS